MAVHFLHGGKGATRPLNDEDAEDYDDVNSDPPFKLIGLAVLTFAVLITKSVYTINTGYVGVCFRGSPGAGEFKGSIQPTLSNPGINFRNPIVDSCDNVHVELQVDNVTGVNCSDKNRQWAYYPLFHIENRLATDAVLSTVSKFGLNYDQKLIHNRVPGLVQSYCAQHTLLDLLNTNMTDIGGSLRAELQASIDNVHGVVGLTIVDVLVPEPPRVSPHVLAMVAKQAELKIQEQVESSRIVAIRAKHAADVVQAEADANLTAYIESKACERNQTKALRMQNVSRIRADTRFYEAQQEAQGNALVHTPQVVAMQIAESMADGSHFYYDKMPDYVGHMHPFPVLEK